MARKALPLTPNAVVTSAVSERLKSALAPLRAVSVSDEAIEQATASYREVLEKLPDVSDEVRNAVLDYPAEARKRLPRSAALKLRRTLDQLVDAPAEDGFVRTAALCAGALEALDLGDLSRSEALIGLADDALLRASYEVSEDVPPLGELAAWAPPPSVLAALLRARAEVVMARTSQFHEATVLPVSDAAQAVAEFARRGALNQRLRGRNEGRGLQALFENELGLAPSLAREYVVAITARTSQGLMVDSVDAMAAEATQRPSSFAEMVTFNLLHVSDLHFREQGLSAFSRHDVTLAETVARLAVNGVKAGELDHIVATGDLASTGDPADLALARAYFSSPVGVPDWLTPLNQPTLSTVASQVSLLPGNHDRYAADGVPGLPGGTHFDQAFAGFWSPAAATWPQCRVAVTRTAKKDGRSLTFVACDLSLRGPSRRPFRRGSGVGGPSETCSRRQFV